MVAEKTTGRSTPPEDRKNWTWKDARTAGTRRMREAAKGVLNLGRPAFQTSGDPGPLAPQSIFSRDEKKTWAGSTDQARRPFPGRATNTRHPADLETDSIFRGFFNEQKTIFTFKGSDISPNGRLPEYAGRESDYRAPEHHARRELLRPSEKSLHPGNEFKAFSARGDQLLRHKDLEEVGLSGADLADFATETLGQPETEPVARFQGTPAPVQSTENSGTDSGSEVASSEVGAEPTDEGRGIINEDFIAEEAPVEESQKGISPRPSAASVGEPSGDISHFNTPEGTSSERMEHDSNAPGSQGLAEANSTFGESISREAARPRFSLEEDEPVDNGEASIPEETEKAEENPVSWPPDPREHSRETVSARAEAQPERPEPVVGRAERIERIRNDPEMDAYEKQVAIARILTTPLEHEKARKPKRKGRYQLDASTLKKNHGVHTVDNFEVEQTRVKLVKTLKDFGIEARVLDVEKGPILTTYAIELGRGIKLSKVTNIQDELKLSLEVTSVRVAPMPGRSTIGVEIPNKKRARVFLGDLINDPGFRDPSWRIPVALGKDIVGQNFFVDLAKQPHMLIAGATGAGKSVALNAMVLSMLYRFSPEELKFIMVDPKVVELQLYNNIPHLLMPVITDPQQAAKALSWTVMEMEKRYTLLSALKTRDLATYNHKVGQLKKQAGLPGIDHLAELEKLPYLVVVIDELGDLMVQCGKDVEGSITRISQKARAVGIHLVMATQRPSVDVITGVIKANCPARVALKVTQKTDSRTILDENGAETLLGAGDLLYKSPNLSDLRRVQTPFVSEEEVQQVVEEVKHFGDANYIELETEVETKSEEGGEDRDEADIDEAWEVIKSDGKASASYLQRRLRWGYNRAANAIEVLEERGFIGPQIGSKPREILK